MELEEFSRRFSERYILKKRVNDSPVGKPTAVAPLKGMLFVATYAIVMTILFGTGMLRSVTGDLRHSATSEGEYTNRIDCVISG